jgi:hypothetical protein
MTEIETRHPDNREEVHRLRDFHKDRCTPFTPEQFF